MRRVGRGLIVAGVVVVIYAYGANVVLDPTLDPVLGVPIANGDLMAQRAMVHEAGWALQIIGVLLFGFDYVGRAIRSGAETKSPTT